MNKRGIQGSNRTRCLYKIEVGPAKSSADVNYY